MPPLRTVSRFALVATVQVIEHHHVFCFREHDATRRGLHATFPLGRCLCPGRAAGGYVESSRRVLGGGSVTRPVFNIACFKRFLRRRGCVRILFAESPRQIFIPPGLKRLSIARAESRFLS